MGNFTKEDEMGEASSTYGKYWTVINSATNFRVPWRMVNFFTIRADIGFTRNLLHGPRFCGLLCV